MTTMDEVYAMATTRRLTLLATLLLPACSSSSPAGAGPTVDAGSGADAIAAMDSGSVESGPADTGSGNAEAGKDSGCVYPAGPYGVDVGKVLDPTATWQTYLANASSPSTFKMTDLYDCDGTKGINAIIFDNTAQWCVGCQQEAPFIEGWMSSMGGNWTALGVAFVSLVTQNNNYEPATIATAKQWRDLFHLSNTIVAADPLITFPTGGLPHTLMADPRTMKVTANFDNDTNFGIQAADPVVAQLAMMNKK